MDDSDIKQDWKLMILHLDYSTVCRLWAGGLYFANPPRDQTSNKETKHAKTSKQGENEETKERLMHVSNALTYVLHCTFSVFIILKWNWSLLFQTPLHLASLSGDLVTVEHIVDMVGIDYLHQLHQITVKTVCTIFEFLSMGIQWNPVLFMATLLIQRPRYYSKFILAQTQAQAVIFLFKEPL